MPRAKALDKPLRVLIAVTGGIAAYKVPLLVRALRRQGCEVRTAVTRNAKALVGLEALRALSGNPVYGDDTPSVYDIDHIRLSQWADVVAVCPATANTIAKIAIGIADNLVTALVLAFEGPVIIAPAMNAAMWRKEITQENVRALSRRGLRVLPVEEGALACGTDGPGRMLAVESIAEHILHAFRPRLLDSVKVLIGSGPTLEPLDPVRVISNRSSGKMGSALAAEALAMGAAVTVVTGPAPAPLPSGVQCITVERGGEMAAALEKEFGAAQICIMAAAVCDFRPESVSKTKIRRRSSDVVNVKLVPNPDILAGLCARKRGQYVVGFALEDTGGLKSARKKMREKKCDMMVLNRPATSLGTDSTTVTILQQGAKPDTLPNMSKREAAREILIRIAQAMGKRNA
jgi:phosphopantothenoylcysteine decarboxylase/phosphopantothenate--cysteine ligase